MSEAYAVNQQWSDALDALDRIARLPISPALAAEVRLKRAAYQQRRVQD